MSGSFVPSSAPNISSVALGECRSFEQGLQDNEAVYVPMGQEDSIAEQAQRRSIASFLGMGDKKDRRRSSNAGEAAPDASTYAQTASLPQLQL